MLIAFLSVARFTAAKPIRREHVEPLMGRPFGITIGPQPPGKRNPAGIAGGADVGRGHQSLI